MAPFLKKENFLRKIFRERFYWIAALFFIGFAATVSFVMNFSWAKFPVDLRAGSIATYSIRADRDYEVTDQDATEKLRQEKLNALLPVFDWDDRASEGMKVVGNKEEVLTPWLQKGILVRTLSKPEEEPAFFKSWNEVYTVEEARRRIPSKQDEIRANLVPNQEVTEARKQKVLSEIRDVVIKIQRGESILRSGDRIAPWHVQVIEGIQARRVHTEVWERWIGTFGFTLLFLTILFFVGRHLYRFTHLTRIDYISQGVLVVILLAVERLFLYFAGGIRELLPFDATLAAFYVALPVAAGSMIMRLILPTSVSVLFTVAFAALSSLLLENSLIYGLYFIVGGLAAVIFASSVRSRSNLFRVGLQVGLINAISLLTLSLVNSATPGGMTFLNELWVLLFFGLCGGLMSSVVTLLFLPLFESSLFNYLTPIKLLEYGSLNHPLLRQMIVQAPGSYHHSHMVGTLAEAACEAIGADALFARVASYFHDIGKMKKAPYYIENQPKGENRHDLLTPSMSALIIAAHVKEGMELAREHKLPKRIRDIIPEHQGTKLIHYFYSKAKEAEKRNLHVVDERHFRYPGPKPQTREAGIILLADTVEAATRSLKEKTSPKLEEVVRNMINRNFVDGQLDECHLTLKDLRKIGKSFVRILMGVYHQRVEYPELVPKETSLRRLAPDDDKYIESTPLKEDSLWEDPALPSEGRARTKTERQGN